jgi:hypothetical protein
MSAARIVIGAACAALTASLITTTLPAQADDAGAFVGGMLAGRVMRNMNERTQAEKQQAYYAQQQAQSAQVQQAQAAPPAQKSTEQRLQELDALAAGGYISPEEYKAKKQQILADM